MKNDIIRIMTKKPEGLLEVCEVKNELSIFQDLVKGYIEVVYFPQNILLICNEEGEIMNLPLNLLLEDDIIVGDIFFCSMKDDEFDSLSLEQEAMIKDLVKEHSVHC